MEKLKVIFMGTPEFAVPILEELIDKYNVILVVSQPDRAKDRKGNILPTPIKEVAIKNNIEVFQPISIKNEYNTILNKNADIIITCAYGQIIPEIILNYPKYGCINVHGSLLPKLRGGAPIHWAIINGFKETGITIMYMDKKMDAGDIISQRKILIEDNDNLDTLYKKMSILGRDLLIDTLPLIINNKVTRIKQNEDEVTFGLNIKKEEEIIDFNKSASDINNLIRGLSSIPGAYTTLDNKRLKIYKATILKEKRKGKVGMITGIEKDGIVINCFDYKIKITDIKLEGKARCLVKDYLNGISDKSSLIGKVLK